LNEINNRLHKLFSLTSESMSTSTAAAAAASALELAAAESAKQTEELRSGALFARESAIKYTNAEAEFTKEAERATKAANTAKSASASATKSASVMEKSATSLHASSTSSTAAAAAARTTETEARARTSALEAEAASLRAKFFSLSRNQQSMDTSDSDTDHSPPHLPLRAPLPNEQLDREMEDDTNDYLGAIDRDLAAKERDMEVDSFLDEMNYSLQHPNLLATMRQGEQQQQQQQISDEAQIAQEQHKHTWVSRRKGRLWQQPQKSSQADATAGGSVDGHRR
jgi:hypothetical protein